jgi:hypothetical protein
VLDVEREQFAERAVLQRRGFAEKLCGSVLALRCGQEIVCQNREKEEIGVEHDVRVGRRVAELGLVVLDV